jgi:hypothetical protein
MVWGKREKFVHTGPSAALHGNPLTIHDLLYIVQPEPMFVNSLRLRERIGGILLILLVLTVVPVSAALTVATSSPQIIVIGDTVALNGTAAMNGTVALWVIGRDYFDLITTVPDKKGDFSFVLKPVDTGKFSTGRYALILQDPGADRTLDITPVFWSDGIRIADNGKNIANIGPEADLPANITPVATAIMNAAGMRDVDDVLTLQYFFVEDAFIRFNRVIDTSEGSRLQDQTTGQGILITGTTNMGVENILRIDIRNQTNGALVTSRTVPVVVGSGLNRWSYELPEPGLPAGNYTITAGWLKSYTNGNGSASIMILAQYISSPLPLPEIPGPVNLYDLLLPLLISITGLGIIAIIMFVALKE